MPTTFKGSSFSVPKNPSSSNIAESNTAIEEVLASNLASKSAKEMKSLSSNNSNLDQKINKQTSLKGLEFINLLNKYNNLVTSLEMFKDLFVEHGKNNHLIELVEDLETVVLFTKNQIKLELQENLTSQG
jgi:hypothetical protein